MRLLLGAAIAALACGAAFAQTVTVSDAAKTFSFDKPQKWPAIEDKTPPGGEVKVFVAGTANEECWFVVYPHPETATATATAVARSWNKEIPAADWTKTTEDAPLIRDGATFVSTSIDTSRPFPIQQAIFNGKNGNVVVAIHPRPGSELRAYCGAYDGKDHTAALQAVAASIKTPKDAEFEAQITAAKAATEAQAAADAAAAAAAAEAAAKGKKKR
ncbi:MAG TPA: hypothetical protein VG735_09160 [Caulobacterales bacterium]|nr:hypothetical protein [Caulobacterales bacterium]